MVKKLIINVQGDKKFEQGFEDFIDSCKARNLRPATINHYQEGYKSIIRFVDKNIISLGRRNLTELQRVSE